MDKKKFLKKFLNIIFILSCLTIVGTIVVFYLLKDSITIYNLGSYLSTLGSIDFICLIIIFMKIKIKS